MQRLREVFRKTHGDLKALTVALVNSPEAWAAPAAKLRTPQEFLWASARALALPVKPALVNRTLGDLGEPLWNPAVAAGLQGRRRDVAGARRMSTRVEVAELLAAQDKSLGDPVDLAHDLLGEALSDDTRVAVSRAESAARRSPCC